MLKLKEIQNMHPFMFVGLEAKDHQSNINSIINSITKITGIEMSKLQSPSRKREIVDARHLFCYFAKKQSKLSCQAIGDIINRNHASVIHAVKKVTQLKQTDREFKELVPKIYNLIQKYERLESD
tara:strand:+ start:512 stop:886 length:375 start_codon:yes stop_codon:yes gene_type:complete